MRPGERELPVALRRVQERTEAFFEWEVQGRSWTVWPYPVALEPPYSLPEPLRQPHARPADTGRVPGLLELPFRLAWWLAKKLLWKVPPEAEESDLTQERQEPTEHATLLLTPSPREFTDPVSWQRLLLALPSLHAALHLEFLGEADRVSLSLQVPADLVTEVKAQVKAHAPSLAVTEGPDRLTSAWNGLDEQGGLIVDFGLAQEFTRPLACASSWKADPLTGLFAALSTVQPGELALFQVQFQLCRKPWAEAATRALLTSEGKPFFQDAPEMLPLARDKFAAPLFAVVCRFACKADSPARGTQLAQSVAGALLPLARMSSNHLMPLEAGPTGGALMEQDLLLRQSRRTGMLLSAAELANLAHPPGSDLNIPRLERALQVSWPAPVSCGGEGVLLGLNEHEGEKRAVRLPNSLRTRHVHLIGASGTGKSTLMLQMLLQDIESGAGVCLIDPHGDLVDELLARMPQERHGDLILVDPSDAEHSVAFNVLHASTDLERQLLSSDLVAIFRRLSSSWGDRMNSVLANALLVFLESSEGGTLLDLRRFLVDAQFRARFLSTVNDSELLYFWEKEYPQLPKASASPVLTRLDTFLRPRLIRHMVAQKTNSFDLRVVMDSSKILLVRLSQGAIGEENAALLGALFVARLQQAAQSRQELRESERVDFSLFLDEFQNYMTPSMAAILSGARKYRMGLVLAHQDLSQLGSRESGILGAAISNPATRICFRLGDRDARSLADGFTHFQSSDLQRLGVGQAVCRVEQANHDFNLQTEPLAKQEAGVAQALRDAAVRRSQVRYARARTDIEIELQKAYVGEEKTAAPRAKRPTSPPGPAEAAAVEQAPVQPSTSVGPSPAAPTSVPPTEPLATVHVQGGGSVGHREWQQRIRHHAIDAGWRARVEASLPGSKGRVDVLLSREDRRIGVEISQTTGAVHEYENIRKCLDASLDLVFCVVVERATRAALKELLAAKLSEAEADMVFVSDPDEALTKLSAHLAAAESESRVERVRGYVVRVEAARRDPSEAQAELAALVKRLWRDPRGRG